jgi:acetolactate synthase I/II/III large subunit
MIGAESLVRTLVAGGADTAFVNPGTSEMHLVQAIDNVPGVRSVLSLFEGVCSGAADGYGRMTSRPAMTLFHLGSGLGNAVANLHNARRGRTPLINIVGDHATYHIKYDAPLTSDVAGIAGPVSNWVRTPTLEDNMAQVGLDTLNAAYTGGGQVASLIVPADCAWGDSDGPATPGAPPTLAQVSDDEIEAAVKAIKAGSRVVLLLGAKALDERGIMAAQRISDATGAELWRETFASKIERGPGLPKVERVPYFPEQVEEALEGTDTIILAGAKEPVSFFAYEGRNSELTPSGCTVVRLAGPRRDASAALEAAADLVGAPKGQEIVCPKERPDLPSSGELSELSVGQAFAALLPDNAIVCDEAITSGVPSHMMSQTAARHTWLTGTGGAIGGGIPMSVGAAIACPDRKVIALIGDGSAMYTVQALWTQARENLDIVTVIFSNRQYRILQIELMRSGAKNPGPKAMAMMNLDNPEIGWVNLAAGLGVDGGRATTADEFSKLLKRGLAQPGPFLIEAVM